MSDIKLHVKVKREHDDHHSPVKMNSSKFPDGLKLVKPSHTVKPKTQDDKVKTESRTLVKKDLHVKKETVSPVKGSETSKSILKIKKNVEESRTVTKDPNAVPKEKNSEGAGKIKLEKKADPAISTGKGATSTDTPKKKKVSKEEADKKEKKVYHLPGQKHDPPDERDPLRIFYESLYQQNPKSEMAEVWMMEHGLLASDAAKKAFERKKKNQLSQKMGSPVKPSKDVTVKSAKSPSKTVIVKVEKKSPSNGEIKLSPKAKRKLDSDDDDDFILKPKKKLKTNAE